MSFASVRIGLYDSVKQFYTRGSDREYLYMHSNSYPGHNLAVSIGPDISLFSDPDVGIGIWLLAGCTTGAMAVAFAQPTDVVKVRFQAQARSPGHDRRYCGTIDAYKTIAKEEGVRGLWKGSLNLRESCSA